MKIRYMSDIHLEFGALEFAEIEPADVLVLAGDFSRIRWTSAM